MTEERENAVRRILFMRFSAMGDVAMTLPVIYSFAQQFPQIKVFVATQLPFDQMFINLPDNVEVIPVNVKSEYKGFWGILKLAKRLSRLRLDYVFDMHNVLRTWLVCLYFRGIGIKVFMTSKHRILRKKITTQSAQSISMIDSHVKALNNAGFSFRLCFESIIKDYSLKERQSMFPKSAIGIAPFARYKNKAYPMAKIENVISSLANEGFYVCLFGGRKEATMLGEIAQKYSNVISVAGRKSLQEELEMMAKLDVMVTMDSANHHLASLVNTRAISIWGSTTPACGFMAYNQSPADAVILGIECQPCTIAGSNKCRRKDFACLNELPETRIVNRIKQIIKEHEQDIK